MRFRCGCCALVFRNRGVVTAISGGVGFSAVPERFWCGSGAVPVRFRAPDDEGVVKRRRGQGLKVRQNGTRQSDHEGTYTLYTLYTLYTHGFTH